MVLHGSWHAPLTGIRQVRHELKIVKFLAKGRRANEQKRKSFLHPAPLTLLSMIARRVPSHN
jgi:hypothetical protein